MVKSNYSHYKKRDKKNFSKIGICKCGHYWYEHTFFCIFSIFTLGIISACDKCECPYYRRHHRHVLFNDCEVCKEMKQ